MTTAIEFPIPPKKNKKNIEKEKENDYLLKIPYVSEPFTRIIKKHVKKSGIKAKVIVSSGTTVKKLSLKPFKKCTCNSCKNGVPCTLRDFVYQAICSKCDEEYIGVSGRPGNKRYEEHAQSIRGKNDRTSLGQHVIQKQKRIKGPKIDNLFKIMKTA